MEFEEGDKIEVLACHPTHMMHEACYAMFKNSNEQHRKANLCPMCRKPIDESKITKRLLQKKIDEHEDPFHAKANPGKVSNTLQIPGVTAGENSINPSVELPEVRSPAN